MKQIQYVYIIVKHCTLQQSLKKTILNVILTQMRYADLAKRNSDKSSFYSKLVRV